MTCSRGWTSRTPKASWFTFDGALTGEQWANIAVTGMIWMVIPLAVGLRFVTRAEVK